MLTFILFQGQMLLFLELRINIRVNHAPILCMSRYSTTENGHSQVESNSSETF